MRRLLAVLAATHALDMKQAPRRMLRKALGNTASIIGAASLVLQPLPSLAAKPSNAASSAGSRVNKDPQSLLRNGLPIDGQIGSATKKKDVRQLQAAVELLGDDLKVKRISAAKSDVQKAATILNSKAKDIAKGNGDIAKLLDEVRTNLDALPAILADTGPAGSPQERESLDKAGAAQQRCASLIGSAEARLVPPGFSYKTPDEYKGVPRLDTRARVRFTLRKADKGDTFKVNGQPYKQAVIDMIVDGYTTPLTSGNFVDLVRKGFYDGMAIQRSDGFVVQTGDPDGPDGPLVGYGQDGDPKKEPRRVPLELFVDGDKAPTYGETTEEGSRGGAATVLPFQAYGALGMARDEYEADSASSQFFWLLFDSDLTPAGKNLLDGRYACFGYSVAGEDFLGAVQEGDVIESAKVLGVGIDP